jgi:hypothetical protein
MINRTAKLLKMNLKDLLDRNLIEKGKLDIVSQPFNLSKLILGVIEVMQY